MAAVSNFTHLRFLLGLVPTHCWYLYFFKNTFLIHTNIHVLVYTSCFYPTLEFPFIRFRPPLLLVFFLIVLLPSLKKWREWRTIPNPIKHSEPRPSSETQRRLAINHLITADKKSGANVREVRIGARASNDRFIRRCEGAARIRDPRGEKTRNVHNVLALL